MFKALLLDQADKRVDARLTELDDTALPDRPVTVRVEYSSLNYKDALAVTGRGAICKTWPIVPGIDLAGVVESSADPAWQAGDRVVINGWGLGETHWGGLAQKARVEPGWLLNLPAGYTTKQAMAVGTAGYTAALCVQALLRHGLAPEKGPVLVTGASGGVGSVAVAVLGSLGFRVLASTGKPQERDYLRALGAAEIVERHTLASPGRPLQTERWAGVVDTLGSHTLVNACAATQWFGAVAACGLAQGADFPGSVVPFILRGVTLYGINCVVTPNEERERAWALLAQHLDHAALDRMTREIGLGDVIATSTDLLDGHRSGRTVVDVNR